MQAAEDLQKVRAAASGERKVRAANLVSDLNLFAHCHQTICCGQTKRLRIG
jgi:hypothetical protein